MRTPEDIYDEWLVLRCQGGDSGALATLVERWQPRLLRLAGRILDDQAEAEDVVQTAWVVVVRQIGSVRDPRALRPWLFRIVANKCADTIRRKTVRRRIVEPMDPTRIEDSSRSVRAVNDHRADDIAQLRNAMRSLDADRRTVLRLHYLEGLSIDQIATQLSVPAGTVKSRLHYARQKLRKTLEG